MLNSQSFEKFKPWDYHIMRGTLTGAAALLITIAVARAQETIPTAGPNCEQASPPARSGLVVAGHSGFFKVFPRKSDMPRDYTGCQTVWSLEFDDRGETFTHRRDVLFYFERGVLVLLRNEQTGVTCPFEGPSATTPAECRDINNMDRNDFPISSLAAGCLEEILATQKAPDWCEQMD